MWGAREVGLGILMAALATLLIGGGASLVLAVWFRGRVVPDDQPVRLTILLLAQIVIDVSAVALAVWVSRRRNRQSPRAWGLRAERPIAVGACLLTLAGAFAVLAIYTLLVRALGVDRLAPQENVPAAFFTRRSVLPLAVFLIVVVAPITEELFFRGFVFTGLVSRSRVGERTTRPALPVLSAAVVSGLLWAVIHGQVGLVVPIAGIGVLLALLYERTGSLWSAILVHAAFNVIGVAGQIAGVFLGA